MLAELKSGVYQENRSPEKNLICAILLRAWADLDSSSKFVQIDAYNWVNTKLVDESTKWSFIWVCEILGLNSNKVKKVMMSIPFHQQVQKLQPDRYKKKKP